jgi:hypothetical protein
VSTGIGVTQVGPSCRRPETNVPARWRRGLPTGPGEPRIAPRKRYLAVLVLFCFGFLGVLAFLSMSLLCRAGRPVADPDATGVRRSLPRGFAPRAATRHRAQIRNRLVVARRSGHVAIRYETPSYSTPWSSVIVGGTHEWKGVVRADFVHDPGNAGRAGRYGAATPAMAGMTSRPMRSSCSRSSPFMR